MTPRDCYKKFWELASQDEEMQMQILNAAMTQHFVNAENFNDLELEEQVLHDKMENFLSSITDPDTGKQVEVYPDNEFQPCFHLTNLK